MTSRTVSPAHSRVADDSTHSSVLLVAAFDSQLKWCAGIRDEQQRRGRSCRVVVPDVRSALSPRQVRDAGFTEVDHVGWDELVELALRAPVVVIVLAGPQIRALSHEVRERAPHGGPVLVSGWVGVIIENRTAGYLDRCGCDVVAVNSADDLDYFRRVADRLDLERDNLVLAGLPFLSDSPAPMATGPIRTVLFADQPTVPHSAHARLRLYRGLIQYARRHPDRTVLLKPRHRRGEDTFHQMAHHPADLLADEAVPANFRLVYEPISELLDDADLLLTVSSTAALEAIDRGVRVAFVTDAGVHEELGNHVFIDSGLLRSFAHIEADDIGVAEPAWLASWFGGRSGRPGEVISDRIDDLLDSGRRPGSRAGDSDWFAGELRRPAESDCYPAWMSRAWRRRVADRGMVLGSASYLGVLASPPLISHAVRRIVKRVNPNAKLY